MQKLPDIFQKLARVKILHFESQSLDGSQMDWNCSGTGETSVEQNGSLLTFRDRFRLDNGRLCRDDKQWLLEDGGLTFFHYREQAFRRIFTFCEQGGDIVCTQPYLCAPDCYSGGLAFDGDGIMLTIRIQGKRKNEVIRYVYR
ncbi:DUF6314 family protein [Neisseria sp. CCUG12390]|uniref:DUF6314 family protein n=1 Tax=Neisseria sp. CCUG12390 TaxID=3392035 RepID=UPI003A1001D1